LYWKRIIVAESLGNPAVFLVENTFFLRRSNMIFLSKDFSRLLFPDRASLVISDTGEITPGRRDPLKPKRLIAAFVTAPTVPPMQNQGKDDNPATSVAVGEPLQSTTTVMNHDALHITSAEQSGKRKVIYRNSAGDVVTTMTGGTLSWRCNNPGNFVYPNSWPGVIGKFEVTGKDGITRNYAIFESYDAGFSALKGRVERSQTLSIKSFVHGYAPESDGNDEDAYVKDIIRNTSFTAESTIAEVGVDKVAGVIKKHEGWSVGTIEGAK
jgi:hypothetical protein